MKSNGTSEHLTLREAAGLLLDECRMVLPGIQALFGFQLIAIFNDRFAAVLSPGQQVLHLVAVGLVAVAVLLVMAPAAYHRQTSTRAITDRFLRVASFMLLVAMLPLLAALSLDFYLVAYAITQATGLSAGMGACLFLIGILLWFAYPRLGNRHRSSE